MNAEINIRPVTEDDIPFLVVTFGESFPRASAYAEGVSKEKLADFLASALLQWPAYVAVTPDDADTILGWIIGTDAVCAYVFVRPELRRKGLATALAAHLGLKPGTPTPGGAPTVITPFAPTRLQWLNRRWLIHFRPWMVS